LVDFLGPDDQPWLRALVEEFDRYGGRCERDLRTRLTEPLPVVAPLAADSGPSRSPIPEHRDQPFQSIVIARSSPT
jgi:hypothetical protein